MNTFVRWWKFNLVGAMGMVVQLCALAAINRFVPGHYLCASAAAVELAVLHNFVWHLHFTWRDRIHDSVLLSQIVRFHRGEYEIEKPIGVLYAAAPAFRVLLYQVKRALVAANRKCQQLLGLLLRPEMRKFGEFRVNGIRGRLRNLRSTGSSGFSRFELGPDGLEVPDFETGVGGCYGED